MGGVRRMKTPENKAAWRIKKLHNKKRLRKKIKFLKILEPMTIVVFCVLFAGFHAKDFAKTEAKIKLNYGWGELDPFRKSTLVINNFFSLFWEGLVDEIKNCSRK